VYRSSHPQNKVQDPEDGTESVRQGSEDLPEETRWKDYSSPQSRWTQAQGDKGSQVQAWTPERQQEMP
jgi:hypothetical protein